MKSDSQICWFSSHSLPCFLPYITPLLLHRSKFGHRIISLLHVLGAVALHRSFHIRIRHVLSRGFLQVVPIAVMDPHWTHPPRTRHYTLYMAPVNLRYHVFLSAGC